MKVNSLCVRKNKCHVILWVKSEHFFCRRLNEQIEKFANDMKSYKFEHIDAEESNVVPCCGELFTIYKVG